MLETQETKSGDSSGLVTPSGEPVEAAAEKPKEEEPPSEMKKEALTTKLVVVETGIYEYIGLLDTVMYYDPFNMLDGKFTAPFILRRAFRMSKAQDQRTGQIITIPFGPFDLFISNPNFVMRDAVKDEKEAHASWLMEAAGLTLARGMPQPGPGPGKRRR